MRNIVPLPMISVSWLATCHVLSWLRSSRVEHMHRGTFVGLGSKVSEFGTFLCELTTSPSASVCFWDALVLSGNGCPDDQLGCVTGLVCTGAGRMCTPILFCELICTLGLRLSHEDRSVGVLLCPPPFEFRFSNHPLCIQHRVRDT